VTVNGEINVPDRSRRAMGTADGVHSDPSLLAVFVSCRPLRMVGALGW